MSGQFTTGKVDFKVGSQTYQTWYKIYGNLKNGQHRPLVTLHGGPGMSHHYMLPHKIIQAQEGIPIVLYDQIGNGASSHCSGVPKEFWTPDLFMDELENLLESLGIHNDFDLIGHSWGGMLAAQFAASRTPAGLKHLIITNSLASMELYAQGTASLIAKFPTHLQQNIQKHQVAGTYHTSEYKDGANHFMKNHLCALDPWPQELAQSFQTFEDNKTVHRTMYGPSEFIIDGILKHWDIVGILHKIPNPTLLISSPEEQTQEVAVLPFFVEIPKIKWVELQNSVHFPMFEEPERYFKIVVEFLKNVRV